MIKRIIAMSRAAQLNRQLREIETIIGNMTKPTRVRLAALVLREIEQAAASQFPHLHGTPPELRYRLWGTGTDTGFERARSDNLQLCMRGIALWLAVAYHETRESPFQETANVYKGVQAQVRTLRELAPGDAGHNGRAVA